MDDRRRIGWLGFWAPALLWLPAGIFAGEILRTGSAEHVMTPSSLVELSAVAPFGLPLALACRRMGRLGYPGPALVAWLALGAAAGAGLLGPFGIGVQAVLACLPVWLAAWRLGRLPRGPGIRPVVTAAGAREVPRAVQRRSLSPPGRRQAGCGAGRRHLPPRSCMSPAGGGTAARAGGEPVQAPTSWCTWP